MVRREEIVILQLNVFKFCCRSLNVRLYNKDSSKAEHACVEVRQSYDCFKVTETETSHHTVTATLATLTQADHCHTWLLQFCILGFDTVACCAVATLQTALLHFTYCAVTFLHTTSHAVFLPLHILHCYTSHTVLLAFYIPLHMQCFYHFTYCTVTIHILYCYLLTYHFTYCAVTTLRITSHTAAVITSHAVLLPLHTLCCYHLTYSAVTTLTCCAVTTSHTVLLPLDIQCCYHFNMLCCYHFTHCVVTTWHTVLLPL